MDTENYNYIKNHEKINHGVKYLKTVRFVRLFDIIIKKLLGGFNFLWQLRVLRIILFYQTESADCFIHAIESAERE